MSSTGRDGGEASGAPRAGMGGVGDSAQPVDAVGAVGAVGSGRRPPGVIAEAGEGGVKVAGGTARDSTGGTAAEPATAAGKTLRKAVAGSTAANEDYDWKDAGHEFIGVRVARSIQRLIVHVWAHLKVAST